MRRPAGILLILGGLVLAAFAEGAALGTLLNPRNLTSGGHAIGVGVVLGLVALSANVLVWAGAQAGWRPAKVA